MFSFKKMFKKAIKVGGAAGVFTGGATATLEGVDTKDKAIVTAVVTVVSFAWTSFWNWRKNRSRV